MRYILVAGFLALTGCNNLAAVGVAVDAGIGAAGMTVDSVKRADGKTVEALDTSNTCYSLSDDKSTVITHDCEQQKSPDLD